eukprot:m51a1_g668 hypothetical protein (1481) ;mRNA; r:246843-252444
MPAYRAISALALGWAALSLASVVPWARQFANCASLGTASSTAPSVQLLWTLRPLDDGGVIDIGIWASGTGTGAVNGYISIAFAAPGVDSAAFHVVGGADVWVAVSSTAPASGTAYCPNGCVQDSSVATGSTCSNTRIGPDPQQDLQNVSLLQSSNGTIQCEFTRRLSTGDANDMNIDQTGQQLLFWAFKNKAQATTAAGTSSYSYHTAKTSLLLQWSAPTWSPACPPKPCYIPSLPAHSSGWGTCSRAVTASSCSLSCTAPDLHAGVLGHHARVHPSSVASGSSCKLGCPQYQTTFSSTCTRGQWDSDSAPVCLNTSIPCAATLVTGASGLGTCAASVPGGTNCSLECGAAYRASTGSCAGGRWLSGAPTCIALSCALALPSHAQGWGTCSAAVLTGLSCSPACLWGYSATSGTCTGGSWSPAPGCAPQPCALDLAVGADSWGTCNASVSSGTTCALTCSTGYVATSGSCSAANWTQRPSCDALPCALVPPANAAGNGTCTSLTPSGTTCQPSCAAGYDAVAGVCTAGSWSPAPRCKVHFPTPTLSNCVALLANPNIYLYWKVVADRVEFQTLTQGISGYFSFGITASSTKFHGGAVDTSTVFPPGDFCASGCVDDGSAARNCLVIDAQNDITTHRVVYDDSTGYMFASFSRGVTSTDTTDVGFNLVGGNTVFWAYSNTAASSSTSYPMHDALGSLSIKWNRVSWDAACPASEVVSEASTGTAGTSDSSLREIHGVFVSPNRVFRLEWWGVEDNTKIEFTMTGRTRGWISFGLNSNGLMKNSDKYVGWVDDNTGKVYAIDSFCTGRVIPRQDIEFGGVDNLENVSGSQNSTHTVITFRRLLDTGDKYDKPIVDSDTHILWAFFKSDGTDITYYDVHGPFAGIDFGDQVVNLLAPSSGEIVGTTTGSLGFLSNSAQAIALTLALAVIAIAIARISKNAIGATRGRLRQGIPPGHSEDAIVMVGSTPLVVKAGDASSAELLETENTDADSDTASCSSASTKRPAWPATVHKPSPLQRVQGVLSHRVSNGVPVWGVLVAAAFVVVNVAWGMYWVLAWPNGDYLEAFAKVTGHLTSVAMLVSVVPATRNSVIVLLLGEPFERTLVFHRWAGLWTWCVLALHTILFFAARGRDVVWDGSRIVKRQAMGLAGLACCAVIVLVSLPVVRRKAYTTFYIMHFATIPFFVFASLHNDKFLPFAYAAVAIWGVDRVGRLLWGTMPHRVLEARLMRGDVLRLRWKRTRLAPRGEPGQYVFVNFPQANPIEWHPFTLTNGPREDECEVNIKSLGYHTRRIVQRLPAIASAATLWVRADGPYGHLSINPAEYEVAVLIAGGIGVTPMISIIRDLFGIGRTIDGAAAAGAVPARPGSLKTILMHWGVPTVEPYAWFADVLELARSAKKNEPTLPTFDLRLHVDSGPTDVPGVSATQGMMNVPKVLTGVAEDYTAQRVAVMVCGPKGLTRVAWDEVMAHKRRGELFDLHYETFTF